MVRDCCVIKLGGGLAATPQLRPWLAWIAGHGGCAVLVPGGGPFADAVRIAQPRLGLDDRAAHDMALLAMNQLGIAFAALQPGLVPAPTPAAIAAVLDRGAVPVWQPWPMLCGEASVPADWAVTSDSLALWLATVLGAAQVLLVKARPAPADADAERLVADGLVDAAFPVFRERFAGRVTLAGPDDAAVPLADAPPWSLAGADRVPAGS